MSRALPPPSLRFPLPLDMLGAWLKPTYGLQNLGIPSLSSPSPRHAQGLGSKLT
jgi:hypothetical protein